MVKRVLSAVSHESYRMFARRYKIKLTKLVRGVRKYRTSKELKKDIYAYEKKNRPKNGMYW